MSPRTALSAPPSHKTNTRFTAPSGRGGSMRLSSGQERLWLLQQLDRKTTAFNIPVVLRFHEGVDFDALDRALYALAERHPVIRWAFDVDRSGAPFAKYVSDFRIPVARRASGPGVNDWQALADELVAEPFDLAAEPPVRALVIECPDGFAVLCVVFHHLIIDARSIEILSKELPALYGSATLKPLNVTYEDFVGWQRSEIDDESVAEHLEFWRQELADLEPLRLPTDRPRPADPGFAGDHVEFELSAALTTALSGFALRHRCTLSSTVATVFQALLYIQSGQEDVTVGTVMGGRENRRFSDVFGFFANTVVIRSRVSSSTSFRELLKLAQRKFLAAHSHQQAPFDQVVAAVQPERRPGHYPIFDFAFSHAGEFPTRYEGGISPVPWSTRATQFDLQLLTYLQDGMLYGSLGFRTSLFDRSTVKGFASRIIRLIDQALEKPDEPISRLNLVTADEIVRSQDRWRAAARPVAAESLVTLFEAQVTRTPDAVALVASNARFTYAELDARANQLAHRLIATGAGADQIIGVIAERGPNVLIAFLAIVKVGAAYLPLSIDDPVDRQRSLLRGSGARLLLSDQTAQIEGIVAVGFDADEFPKHSPGVDVHADQLAYVICTSGSTGEPKGVAIAHRQVADLALDRGWEGKVERVLHHSAHTFDAATLEIWVPLLSGGRVVLAPPGRLDVDTLERLIVEESLTWMFVSAGLFRVFAEQRPQAFAGVREVWTGADLVSPQAVATVLEHCPGIVVVNAYGPTETTSFSTAHRVRDLCQTAGPLPIGTPRENTRCYVLDANLRPAPEGVIGELFITGAGVARGYLNRPDFTAMRFVADPLGLPGGRMYRTGDLARWRTDGVLEFFGRADDQLKIRGYRVETGEIEHALAKLPGVAQAVVVVRKENGDNTLIAYLVPAPHAQLSEAELRRSLAENLPGYLIPSAFVVLDALPITANGKLDRKALPAPVHESSSSGRGPANPVEGVLCALFAESLGLDSVSLDDNFFELGGHSLLATGLVGKIKSSLGVELSMSDLFRAQTVAQLSALLDSRDSTNSEGVLLPIRTDGKGPPVFFIHPGVGLSWCYVGFTKHLRGIPIYGLQARAASDASLLAPTLTDMAVDYLEQIREVCPRGPFRLAGWSFGANVAHTIAAMLQDAGAEVELLALIDGYPYAGNPPGSTGSERSDEAEDLATVRRLYLNGAGLVGVDDVRAAELTAILAHSKVLAKAHTPLVFDGDVLFFSATGHPDTAALRPSAWRPFITGSIRTQAVAAEHHEMMQPVPLAQIAEVLGAELASARQA